MYVHIRSCMCMVCIIPFPRCKNVCMYNMQNIVSFIGTNNYRSLLQKSPIKETIYLCMLATPYGVATINKLLTIIGLFCRI